MFGGIGNAKSFEDLYDFDFNTLSWSTAELATLKQPAGYLATCHQDSAVVMGGHRLDGPVETVQSIYPHYTPPADDEADASSMRYELGSDLRELLQERKFTDLTLQVEGKTWEVHRLVLVSCSPFLKQVLRCGPAPGTSHDFSLVNSPAQHILSA